MITQETIAQIKEAADIVDVVGEFVQYKKRGRNLMACCPFHGEKTPSFSVSPEKGIYKCFGCGVSGDSVKFVMEHERYTYTEALRWLAKRYNIEVKEDRNIDAEKLQQENSERESLLIVLNYAKNFYQKKLTEDPTGQAIGMSYFKERGFSQETIADFELGYSMDEWDALYKDALKQNYNADHLEKAGLVIRKEEGKIFDRFRGRVIFPIHNVAGKVIAFGARILKTDKNQPKYLNSPETEVYHKSQVLYGIYQAKNTIRSEENCYLVEGYTDVISLYQAGIKNVVASSGTSLTQEQIKLIRRFSQNVTVLYDGDAAGIKASVRGIDMILEEGLNVKVVCFPDGEDPDSYVKKLGSNEFKNYLKDKAQDFISFKTELYLKDVQNDPIKRAEVIREVVTSISKIQDGITRAVYFQQCSRLLDISESTLISEYNKLKLQQKKQKGNEGDEELIADLMQPVVQEQPRVATNSLLLQEIEVVRLLVNYANIVINEEEKLTLFSHLVVEVEDIDFEHPLAKRVMEKYILVFEKGFIPTYEYFLNEEDDVVKSFVIDQITDKYYLSENWEKRHQVLVPAKDQELLEVLTTAVYRLKWRKVQQMSKEMQRQLGDITDHTEMEKQLKILIALKEQEKQLAAFIGNVVAK